MPLSRLLLPALAAACLLPAVPASAGGDLWGGATAEQRPAHATRAERIRALDAAERPPRPGFPRSSRRGSFVIVDGPSVSSSRGARFRGGLQPGGLQPGGLQPGVRGTASLRFGDRRGRFGSSRGEVIVRGGTGGLVLQAPRGGTHRFDRGGRFHRDAFAPRRFDRRASGGSGGFLRNRSSAAFDRGFGRPDAGRDAAFERGFRRGFEAGASRDFRGARDFRGFRGNRGIQRRDSRNGFLQGRGGFLRSGGNSAEFRFRD